MYDAILSITCVKLRTTIQTTTPMHIPIVTNASNYAMSVKPISCGFNGLFSSVVPCFSDLFSFKPVNSNYFHSTDYRSLFCPSCSFLVPHTAYLTYYVLLYLLRLCHRKKTSLPAVYDVTGERQQLNVLMSESSH